METSTICNNVNNKLNNFKYCIMILHWYNLMLFENNVNMYLLMMLEGFHSISNLLVYNLQLFKVIMFLLSLK